MTQLIGILVAIVIATVFLAPAVLRPTLGRIVLSAMLLGFRGLAAGAGSWCERLNILRQPDSAHAHLPPQTDRRLQLLCVYLPERDPLARTRAGLASAARSWS